MTQLRRRRIEKARRKSTGRRTRRIKSGIRSTRRTRNTRKIRSTSIIGETMKEVEMLLVVIRMQRVLMKVVLIQERD